MRVVCLFFFQCVYWTFPVSELFIKNEYQSRIYVDEWIESLQLVSTKQTSVKPIGASNLVWNILQLSQSIPIRIIKDKNLIQILPPTFIRKREKFEFRANIIALYNLNLLEKLDSMNGWFQRCRVSHNIIGKNRYILINLTMDQQFYLNQFDTDFNSFTSATLGASPYELVTYQTDWQSVQRDLVYENHRGLIPNPYSTFNQDFSKKSRISPGSNVQP